MGSSTIYGGLGQCGQHAKTRRGGGVIGGIGSVRAGHEQRKEMNLTRGPDVSARGESMGSYAGLRWARPRGERGTGEGRPSGAAQERERGGWACGGEQANWASRPKMREGESFPFLFLN